MRRLWTRNLSRCVPPGLLLLLFIALMQAAVPGCGGGVDPCIPGFAKGKTYRITIVEPYTAQAKTAAFDPDKAYVVYINDVPQQTCGEGLDLVAGSRIGVQVNKIRDDNPFCSYPEGTVVSADNVTINYKDTFAGGGGSVPEFMKTWSYQVRLSGQCSGIWFLQLFAYDKQPFGTDTPNAPPHLLVRRSFWADDPTEACLRPGSTLSREQSSCEDYFVATMTPE
jgi:hypothetical protein